jgi:glucose-6-phosphate isomerase
VVESVEPLRQTSAWRRLEWHYADVRHTHLREHFAGDPGRGERLTAEAAGLYFDYSKNLLTDETLELLRKLAAERGLEYQVMELDRVRRASVERARAELEPMVGLAEEVRSGAWLGATGKRIRAVIDVSVGGSQLGRALAYEALRRQAPSELECRFVSNVDPADLETALAGLDPAETLFVVVAGAGPGLETLSNAGAAREWIEASLGGGALGRHFFGVVAEAEAAQLGVPPENVLRSEDGVNPLRTVEAMATCIALGPAVFAELQAGSDAMDRHFARAPLGGNLPALAGLIAVWCRNFLGAESTAVVPYARALRLLPPYLQHLSAGTSARSVTEAGAPVAVDTAPVVWGSVGTDAEHTFFRLLHEGTVLCPVDLIGIARPSAGPAERHDLLAASLMSQANELAFGRTAEELEDSGVATEDIPHRVRPGNRPTSVLLMESLCPATLGALLAFYEHRAFTQAAIWELDAVDRPGLGVGEELRARLVSELAPGWKHELLHDSSTNALVRRYRELRDARR